MLLTTLNSCDSTKKAIENDKKIQESLSGTYYITDLGDTEVSSNKIVITFDDTSNKVTGFAGCNSFFGNYSIDDNAITFENIGASKKLCHSEVSKLENQFLKALNATDSFSIKDNFVSFLTNETVAFKGSSTVVPSKKSASTNGTYKTAVKYETLTRGAFDFVLISKNNIFLSKDPSLQNIEKYKSDIKAWEELKNLIEAIDLEGLSDLKPPSKKHQYDGAPHATLTIQIGDVEYRAPTFDHGNPPKEIEVLVNKVLSIKEKTVKN